MHRLFSLLTGVRAEDSTMESKQKMPTQMRWKTIFCRAVSISCQYVFIFFSHSKGKTKRLNEITAQLTIWHMEWAYNSWILFYCANIALFLCGGWQADRGTPNTRLHPAEQQKKKLTQVYWRMHHNHKHSQRAAVVASAIALHNSYEKNK